MFPIPILSRAAAGLCSIACAACAGVAPIPDASRAPTVFYTVTAEIALSRHEPRVAARQYAAATENDRDPGLLERAAQVTTQCLQPSLTLDVANRWLEADPASAEANRALAAAELELQQIPLSAEHYRRVLTTSPRGTDAEFASLETELAATDNVYGARQLADRLAADFPGSRAALRIQAYTALRADDPAAAVRSFRAALAMPDAKPAATPAPESAPSAAAPTAPGGPPIEDAEARERHALTLGLWRAQILSGDAAEPLARGRALLDGENTALNRLDYVLLLLAAQQNSAARAQLSMLAHDPDYAPVALRLLGLLDYQDGKLDDAAVRFAELLATGKFLDDALYYLGLIAERHDDLERALRLYAQVQNGDNALPALLRAATLLQGHGAAPAAEELLDALVEEEPLRAPQILASRARIYANAGDMPRAVAVLDQAMLQYPDNVDLRYAMASLQEEQGKVSVALRELKAVARLRPDDPAALNAYGYTLADHDRRLGLAHRLIERAHAAAPKNAAILDSYGWVLFRQGHGEQALPYLNAAYEDDRGADIAAHLGEVLWRLGRQADAERIWSEGARTDADNHLLKSTRQRLHAAN